MGNLKFLTGEEKEFYDKNGFVKLSRVFTDSEIQSISNEYDDLFERKKKENLDALESAWVGDRMKQEAGYIDYTVCVLAVQFHHFHIHYTYIPAGKMKLQTPARVTSALLNIKKSQKSIHALQKIWCASRAKQAFGSRVVAVLGFQKAHFTPLVHNILLTHLLQTQVKSIHNLQMHSAEFTKVITHPKLLDAIEDILGTENILLHHTKAHIKPPENGAPYLMHQDYPYFPFKNHTMLAVFLHLDDTTPENGGLAVYPGSHKLGPLEDKGLTDKDGEEYHYVDQDRFPLSKAVPISAKRGEIIIFSYLLLHGSYLNLSNRSRRMFLIQLRAAEDEPTRMCHLSPAQNLVLRGKNKSRKATMANRFVDH